MVTERLSLEGHLLNDHTLLDVFQILDDHGVQYWVKRMIVGAHAEETSFVELRLQAETQEQMNRALKACEPHGVQFTIDPAQLVEADMDGVWPEGFYSTTNFSTQVFVKGQWIEVEDIEMDVGIKVFEDNGQIRAVTCPMHKAKKGDMFVVGFEGVKVAPREEEELDADEFRFMSNDVSSERPKSRMIAHCVESIRQAKASGKRILLVGGPAIVHSDSIAELECLINEGWIDVLFAGNALAAHDIEAAMMGTSLGVDLMKGESVSHGHSNHLRCINRVRRYGSIKVAIDKGALKCGIMHAAVTKPIPFVLCGSIRDDGPLPDVITDCVQAQDEMRKHVSNVGVALMVATTLHSVATGNILPATVKTYCVDSDADTVIKLTDRGTHQAIGLVTDCEFFLKELCRQLCG